MQDIFNSVKYDIKDIENIIDEYKAINEDINKLFDTRVLPLPEEYVTPKNKLNFNKYK